MSSFTTPFISELIGPYQFKVVEEFEYHIGEIGGGLVITIPVGFVTNFASSPRILWPIYSPVDLGAKAAAVHDYLYDIKMFSRKRCDEIFLEGLEVLGVPKWKRYGAYYGVRMLGWLKYGKQ